MSKVSEELKSELASPARAYTKKEVASFIKTSPAWVDVLSQFGLIQGIKMPNATIFSSAEIERFLDENRGEDLSSRDAIQKLLERRNIQ